MVMIVLLVTMTTMQSWRCCHGRMVCHPHVPFYISSDLYETMLTDGRFPKGSLHLSDGLLHKENSEVFTTLTPENGCGYHFIEKLYLLVC